MTQQMLTSGDVARELEVAPETVRLWERLGKLPAVRTLSGVRLFSRADVDQLARRRQAHRCGVARSAAVSVGTPALVASHG